MNFETGKRIHGYRSTELSMPQHIIDKVHELAADAEGGPDLDDDGCPLFKWEIGAPVNAENEEMIENAVPVPDDEAVENNDIDDNENDHDNQDDNDYNESIRSDNQDDNDDNESIRPDNLHGDSNGNNEDDDDDDDDDESISDDSPPGPQLKTRSDDESISDYSVESIDEIRSEIDAKSVIEGKRVRPARVQQPNISSFGGKKYNVNMLNIGQDEFAKFEAKLIWVIN